jgi:dihydrodipicolinate synthase/N-acetylneuraminate lyase
MGVPCMPRFPACILSTCVVPWDEQGNFVEGLFRHQVRVMAEQGTKHLYIFGTAGEGYAVTEGQFDRIIGVFSDELRADGGEPMVGVISLSLGTILDRIARARDSGVRLFQISLPSWGALTEGEVFEFFRQTCGRFPDCRFLHYNLMRTKRLVTPDEYARLAAEHPNLVATKNSTDSIVRVRDLLARAPELTHFLTEDGYAYGSLVGECGLLASIAMTNFDGCRAFFEAGRRRDARALIEMQQELAAVTHELMVAAGDAAHMDGAFDKLLWRLHDPRFPMRLLPPYTCLSEAACEQLGRVLREKYPRWAP